MRGLIFLTNLNQFLSLSVLILSAQLLLKGYVYDFGQIIFFDFDCLQFFSTCNTFLMINHILSAS